MARALVAWGPRFYGRTLRGCVHEYSSIPEKKFCITTATEEKIKKVGIGGKKSIAKKPIIVVDKIHDMRLPLELRRGGGNNTANADSSRIEADIVNVAEQRILRSMMNGDFEKLSGKDRPLKFESHPHVDPAEEMTYRILAKNGFAPEWVELNKEIHVKIQRWRSALALAYQRKLKANSGKEESEAVSLTWKALLSEFEEKLAKINRNVTLSLRPY